MSKIIVDVHEPDDIKESLNCTVEHLTVGDYMLFGERGNVVIERKEVNDLANSVRDNRFWEQLQGLKVLEEGGFRPLVIIEGEVWKVFKFRKMNLSQWFGLQQAITVGYGIPIIQTRDKEQTVTFLKVLDSRLGKAKKYMKPPDVKKSNRTPVEQAEDMLCAVDLIGRKKAQDILARYSIRDIVINPHLLASVKGIGDKVISNFMSVISARR